MTFTYGLQLWFLALYAFAIVAFVFSAIRFRPRRDKVEKQKGPLPSPGVLFPLGVPPVILVAEVGHFAGEWLPLRLVGLGLSLYFLVMLPWGIRTLGRFYTPGIAIYTDHTLITSGPFHIVRHPIASAVVALWLGAALGTLNWLLLVLWPLLLAITFWVPIRHDEKFLYEKFGKAYEQYAEKTSQLIPWVW